MNRQNANPNFLYKLHPLQWSVVALLILNLVAPFAPSDNEPSLEQIDEDMGNIVLISDESGALSHESVEQALLVEPSEHTIASSQMHTNPRMLNAELTLFPETNMEAPAQETDKLVCYEIGPLVTEEMEEFLKKTLMPKGMALEINIVKQKEKIGYWVFIPPLRSKALGRLKVEEIKLKGVKDVVLLTKNKPRYSISLGIFNDEKFATQRLLKIQALGFNAKQEVRYKSLDEKWMFIEVAEKDDIKPEEWQDLLVNYQPVKFRSQECK